MPSPAGVDAGSGRSAPERPNRPSLDAGEPRGVKFGPSDAPDVLKTLLCRAFWAMLPAYVPNNVAVLAGGDRPLDAGLTWRGRRLLGDGKTWRGTALGTAAGVALAMLLNAIRGVAAERLGLDADASFPAFSLRSAFALAAGAMLGDVGASFLKRRTGRERGSAFPALDQLDFVAGALSFSALFVPDWFRRTFTKPVLAVVLVATPLLHVGMNAVAYLLGLKDEPW